MSNCISYVAIVRPKLATRARTRRVNEIPATCLYSMMDEESMEVEKIKVISTVSVI